MTHRRFMPNSHCLTRTIFALVRSSIPFDRRKKRMLLQKSFSSAVDNVDCGNTGSSNQLKLAPLHRSWTFACDAASLCQMPEDRGCSSTSEFAHSLPSCHVSRKVETWINSCASSPLELQVGLHSCRLCVLAGKVTVKMNRVVRN